MRGLFPLVFHVFKRIYKCAFFYEKFKKILDKISTLINKLRIFIQKK